MRGDLLEGYRNSLGEAARAYRVPRMRKFLEWLGDGEVDSEAVRKWLDKMRRENYADGTVWLEFSILRRMFKVNDIPWPFRRGDAPVVREHQVHAPRLDVGDVERMVRVVLGQEEPQGIIVPDVRHKVFLCLSTVWALRREEMWEMERSFFDAERRLLFVQTAKHGRQRWHTVPPVLVPHLAEWGFDKRLSPSKISVLFQDLKRMIGFTDPVSYGVGWHSIRRAWVNTAEGVGIPDSAINNFCRWKRSSSDMRSRYGTSRVVGTSIDARELGQGDRQVDELVYHLHPFLQYWGNGAPEA